MEANGTVLVFGGDRRLTFLAEGLTEYFTEVITYPLHSCDHGKEISDSEIAFLEEAFAKADIIVGPIPFSRDGVHVWSERGKMVTIDVFGEYMQKGQQLFAGKIPETLINKIKEKGVICHDFMKMEQVEEENSLATAEGALAEAITLSVNNLHTGNCLILGYGKCGKAIANLLKGWQIPTTVAVRREEARAEAESQGFHGVLLEQLTERIGSMTFIFNTIPAMVLKGELLDRLEKDAVIVDIASAPGGTDFETCERLGIKAVLSLGIPGRYSPKTSADILLRAMLPICEKEKRL